MKKTGILMPLSSLPSRTGIGELGASAYEWLDLLEENGITIWQLLPLNPVGYGNSPYQPYSSCAGDEIYISLDQLYEEGMLDEQPPAFRKEAKRVDYDAVRAFKEPYLRKAYQGFQGAETYEAFAAQDWVRKYGVFRALKRANGGVCWNEWPREHKEWPENGGTLDTAILDEAKYQIFLQYQQFFLNFPRPGNFRFFTGL